MTEPPAICCVIARQLSVMVTARADESGVDQIDRTKEVHLADIDAVVAEDRVGHRDMEIDVRDRHLQQVVLAAKDLAGRPGEADLPLGGAGVLRFPHPPPQAHRLPDAAPHPTTPLLLSLLL